MNTGTPESNYGYWYPGKENDGGAGGGFEPAPYGQTWLNQPHHRGPWYYSSEVDLGYSGALRTAATVLAEDPIFGRFCFGGDWRLRAGGIEVIPKDGLRRRFHAFLGDKKVHMIFDADRFVATQPIELKDDLTEIHFKLESDNPKDHSTTLHLSGLTPGIYSLRAGIKPVATFQINEETESRIEVPVNRMTRQRVFTITRSS
jgi:hypothetical protein